MDGTVSAAVDAVMDRKDDVISDIRKAHGRYEAAGNALVTYAGVLDRVQADTLAALNKAIDALDESADATGTKSRWQQFADDATDPHEKTVYQHKADAAGDQVTAAHGVVNAAKGDIDTAVSDRDRAADNAISQITDIAAHDDLNDSWWDDWGSKVVAAIADIADVISTIAGILAIVVAFIPVVGTALAGVLLVVAAVAAIVSALANIALAATGERSWLDAGIAIAGAALSVIGLGAAAKAATGISKVALKTGARESLAGLKGLGKGGIKNSLDGFGRKAACKIGFGTCFTAGTLVRTPDGDKPIETLRPGDKVYTHDPAAGVDVIETIEETFVRTTTTLYHLTIVGHRVTTTDEHPFMVAGLGWIHARDLAAGDLLVTADDSEADTVRLDAVEIEHVDDEPGVTVYNIHVRTHHTYYVSAGDHCVLVHNSTCGPFANSMPHSLERELALADRLGVVPIAPGSGAFDDAISEGTVKWAVREDKSLVIIPKHVHGQEISHSTLTRGGPVLAAGEADIAGTAADGYLGLEINYHSGHFLPSETSLDLGRSAFSAAGVSFS
ncbi:intein [Luteimicrobium subarcticum]|uniref:Intein n=2 Tax=Luteimicrobium subarcticum TaxID=620910 RepID=A0A2M8WW33_9MICO|nr:intein [Luteimicrobium subarcticum]